MMDLTQYYKASAIIDNNVLVDLFELERLNLIFEVFGRVGIPRVIFEEVTHTRFGVHSFLKSLELI